MSEQGVRIGEPGMRETVLGVLGQRFLEELRRLPEPLPVR
jgi:hypothetical protein